MPIDPNTTNKITIPSLPELGRNLLDTDLLVGHDGSDMRRILGSRVRAFVQGSIVVPLLLSDGETALTTGNNKSVLYAPLNLDIINILASLSAPGTTLTEVDIKRNGTSIFGANKLTIDPNENTSATAATPPSVSYPVQLDALDRLALDVLQAGTGAVGLKVWLVATVRP